MWLIMDLLMDHRNGLKKIIMMLSLIRLDKNYGFAGGYNVALDQIDARYFVLLNSDIEVTPGWLAAIGKFHG